MVPHTTTIEARPASSPPTNFATLIAFSPAIILFIIGGISEITAPGLYMDAINPDYAVVRALNPGTTTPAWTLPGTLLFDLFPIIGQVYHGALPFYMGLPSYALFGTGVIGIRLTNIIFGLAVLISTAVFLRAFRVRLLISGTFLAALALDPGFLFSFRSQFYITLLPITFVFLSIALVEHHRGAPPTVRVAMAAGFLAGFAVYGYFIHAFLTPTAALHALWRWRNSTDRLRTATWWIIGFALGGSPYVVGLGLVYIATGGLAGFLAFLTGNVKTLAVSSSPLSLAERAVYAANMVQWTVLDVGPSLAMLRKMVASAFPNVRLALLLGVPALGLMLNLARRPRSPGLFVAAGLFLGISTLIMIFGTRVWLHHAILFLPILYVALALTVELLAIHIAARGIILVGVILLATPLFAVNLVNRQAMLFELGRTGGVGLASDAIVRFSEDGLRNTAPTHAFFPDWGIFMAFEMITRGRIPLTTTFTPQEARQVLCRGKDALLGIMDGAVEGQPEPARVADPTRLPKWIAEVEWGQPEITVYRQRDGMPVMSAVRWRASEPAHVPCP